MYVMIMLAMLQGNVTQASVLPYMYDTETQCNKALTDAIISLVAEDTDLSKALQNRTVRMQCAHIVEESY